MKFKARDDETVIHRESEPPSIRTVTAEDDEQADPPPRGGGDRPRGHPRQAGIIDGDQTINAIVDALTSLAKSFEKTSRPPLPAFRFSKTLVRISLASKKTSSLI